MPLEELKRFDPDLARKAADTVGRLAPEDLRRMVTDTLWASSMEIAFGRAVLEGYVGLAAGAPAAAAAYHRLLREFGSQGPALGKLMAVHLPPVLRRRDPRLERDFVRVVGVMRAKGNYTLPDPLKTLSALLQLDEADASGTFLELLEAVFARDLSYVRCQHFAYVLPRAVMSFPAHRRSCQTAQLVRVVRIDPLLADPFLDGLRAGLGLLSPDALAEFVTHSAEIFGRNPRQAAKFISLSSQSGTAAFRRLQVTVSFDEIRAPLNRYLQARLGRGVSVRPLSSLSAAAGFTPHAGPTAVSDSRWIYLPDEIGHFPDAAQNRDLYKTLARLESGHFEFGTFDFDLEQMAGEAETAPARGAETDLQAFLDTFPEPALAGALFTAFEHGRIRKCLARRYPGLVRRCLPPLHSEARRLFAAGGVDGPLHTLYRLCALGMGEETLADRDTPLPEPIRTVFRRFDRQIDADAPPEACGRLVVDIYDRIACMVQRIAGPAGGGYDMSIPFGRTLRPDLVAASRWDLDRRVRRIRDWLRRRGYRVTTARLRRHLADSGGRISAESLRRVVLGTRSAGERVSDGAEPSPTSPGLEDFEQLLQADAGRMSLEDDTPDGELGCPVFRYDEWDRGMSDYLRDHVRVCERPIPGGSADFYPETLARRRGLTRRMRTAFELLKPQGLKLLRRWVEGDEFDYRALLNAALERRAGLIPSDRLYNKRVKQQREVSVLLLVDLSRSTANRVRGAEATVLDVEKEAIVLFCEALTVVGDDFSIAGFSGTGRLGVDYYTVKGFAEALDDGVRQRIGALAPQRATRMGAAIRHAVNRLEQVPSRVRLLIILGDGFPNDVDYKQRYAVDDTRRAVFEARSKSIFTHAITVNIAGDPRLDDLYGHGRHTVLSDVRELPDKLLRVYGSLTRY